MARKPTFGPGRYLFEESKRAYDFETQIDNFVVNSEQKMLIVMRESIDAVVNDAQTPVAKGGRMRVKTGFLRSSGAAALNMVPRGATKGDPNMVYDYSGTSVNEALARMKIGDVFYFGWTANYARVREAYDGFLEVAVQKWQQFVNQSVGKFKK